MLPPEILGIIYVVIFFAALAYLYRVFEKRVSEISHRMDETSTLLRERFEKDLSELRAHMDKVQQAAASDFNARIEESARIAEDATGALKALDARVGEFEKRLDAALVGATRSTRTELDAFSEKIRTIQNRLQEFAGSLRDHQESTRASVERTLEAMEKRWAAAAADESSEDVNKVRRFKDEMPQFEEKFSELADRHRELSANAKRTLEQHKALAEKIAAAKSDDERKEFLRQATALFQGLGRTVNASRDLFIGGEEALRQLIQEMSPLYKVCEVCNEVRDTLSICLNCGKKYCDECKGLQIGHCKECAPYVKPLHLEVRDT